MTEETIYDLAWCAPDAPYTAKQISERILREQGLVLSPEECQRRMDEFWARIDAARVR